MVVAEQSMARTELVGLLYFCRVVQPRSCGDCAVHVLGFWTRVAAVSLRLKLEGFGKCSLCGLLYKEWLATSWRALWKATLTR